MSEEVRVILAFMTEIQGLVSRVKAELPPSRQASLAVTKLEEACHWLTDLAADD